VIVAYLTAARLAFARGARDDARRRLQEAELTAHRRSWPRLVAAARFEGVRFALREGSLVEARSLRARISEDLLAAEERPLRPHAGETEAQEIGDLRLRVHRGEARRALADIQAARREARRDGRRWRALRLATLEVQALDAAGEHAAALRRLREELREAAPERFVRSFADEGKAITRLVRELRGKAPDPDDDAYLDAILRAAGESVAPRVAAAALVFEPLSRREQEILDLLGEGLSNRAIGARLFVSENTVKFHLKAIFAKLGVTTRAQAAAVARRAGLV
jgi:LuxR family maltose regulon positive regulatory protein